MKLPRKTVIDRQADHIRNTFDDVDDKALALLHGGQPRYGIALPPRELDPTTDGSTTSTTTEQPQPTTTQQPQTPTGDLLAPPPPVKKL